MAASYEIILTISICIHSMLYQAIGAVEQNVQLPRQSTKGSLVAKLPWESGQKSEIVSLLGSDLFDVHDGDVVLTKDLSNFLHETLPLVIKHELGNRKWFDTLHVKIPSTSSSGNNKAPSFSSCEYAVTLDYADAISGETILSVPASYAYGKTIRYVLKPDDVFTVSENGDISVKYPLNVMDKKYILELVAIDSDESTSLPVRITITVTSDLKFKPHHRVRRQITQRNNIVTVLENVTTVHTIEATPGNTPIYRIANSSVPNLFKMTGRSVVLNTGQRLDYEKEDQRQITVVVNGEVGNEITETINIQISVRNVNDEAPRFITKPEPYLATVSTTAPEGQTVFTLMAMDDDGDLAQVEYFLVSGGESRFSVDRNSGAITVVGSTTFPRNKEYFLLVEARDVAATPEQKTPQKNVQILVGERPPQIFEPRYNVNVPEEANVPYLVETIKARRFQDAELRYTLQNNFGEVPNPFTITSNGPDAGLVKLVQTLDYESQTQPKDYNLRVIVSEMSASGFSSSVTLFVSVTDINDHDPRFALSTYNRLPVSEDASLNFPLLNVTAVDQDSGRNAELEFSVSNDLFAADTVGSSGIIKVNGLLDFDRTPGHRYEFLVIATDKGESPRSGSATVVIVVTNVNDEVPEFSTNLKAEVLENANVDQYVHTVHVRDPDGDTVRVYFKDPVTGNRVNRNGPFEIIPDTGRVSLWQTLPRDTLHYVLNLTAVDDGNCCPPPNVRLTSEAALIVEVMDVNDNRPEFPNCTLYQNNPPSVKENSLVGSPVFQVKAVDADQGENGKIRYDLLLTTVETKFRINSDNGMIMVNQLIDREAQDGARDIGITVQASDNGNPRLNGICSFRILVEDMNDNNPVFTQNPYKATLIQTSKADDSVTRVVANDMDSGENRLVEYSLTSNPNNLFKIDNETGIIRLAVDLGDISDLQVIEVMARDHGTPVRLNSTASVEVRVQANLVRPPQWQGDIAKNIPIRINETHPLVHTNPIARLQATRDGGGNVDFLFISGKTAVANDGPFSIYRPPNLPDVMDIILRSSLDYETRTSYELKIRAAANNANSDIIVRVEVLDQNDEAPSFRGFNPIGLTINGSLTEGRSDLQTVVTLQAIDEDKSEAFRRLRYSFFNDQNGDVARNFSLDGDTGIITTTTTFDLEAHPQGVIRFTVKVDDRVPSVDPTVPAGQPNSATATVEVVILDVNDNKPRFTQKQWNATVLENVEIGRRLLTLSAKDKDKDSQMTFSIISAGNDFTVVSNTGNLKVANLLDFDDPDRRVYNLTVQVYDGIFTDTAQVVIYVLDANDNDPVFSMNPYTVLNITEEDDNVPMRIIQVLATDPDLERPNNIEYSLNGPLAEDGTFDIDRVTGEIRLLRKLDRDYPRGHETYEFNVLATDEPGDDNKRTGVSYVRVLPIDINDNAPVFQQDLLLGSVPEHSTGRAPGTRVFAVNALDYDAGDNARVEYSIVSVDQFNGQPLFRIDRVSGQISVSVMDDTVLDRETKDTYSLVVQAQDKGSPPLSTNQTITINLSDINDQRPVFSQNIYRVTMSENLPEGTSIISVTASDLDSGINAQLIYSLETDYDKGYFYIETRNATNEGILRVFESEKIDFENELTQSFNVTVSVDDVPSPSHKILAHIEVTVEDFNDNAPVFKQESIQIPEYENIPVGKVLGTFTATDADSGINSQFEYSIDHSENSDPKRQFKIDETGVVTLNKPLDRETQSRHEVTILAIDKGTPQQTGRAVLVINVQDINDNAPEFAKDYVVYFEENLNEVQTWPEDIEAIDRDLPINGPPFTFSLPCNNQCPCQNNSICGYFNMTFQRTSAKPDGFARVFTANRMFDRETQKEYRMPIVMWDSGEPVMTGTNQLRIIIKDKNDNPHEPAVKDIFVYFYEGFKPLKDLEIGRVYAKDPDDWDIPDKDFKVVDPEKVPEYFSVDINSGMVKMSGKPPEAVYFFEVSVFDKVKNINVISKVRVTVKGIPTDAVYSSGSIRLKDITDREFVEREHAASGKIGEYNPSKYDLMQTFLANKLGVPESNVEIFTVRDNKAKGATDVRFAAHGSPWYKPSKLDGLIITNKQEFENQVGVKVGMVPIDECLDEQGCDHGCNNKYVVLDEPKVVYGNSSSFVGVNAYFEKDCNDCNGTGLGQCKCKASEFPAACRSDFCYNGGTCFKDDWHELRCKCDEGFDGDRCQETKHSFRGNGYALYPTLSQCEFGRTSLEFITRQPDGLLFYNGQNEEGDLQDFIALQLSGGDPVLHINHGTGTLPLLLPNKNLADNKWHRIDIVSEGKTITMTVDNCDSAVITEDDRSSIEDRTSCEVSGETPGENMFLNMNSLLQMGGTISDTPPFLREKKRDFDGCIKNFRHLGKLYDLHIGNTGHHSNTQDGCPQEDKTCGSVNDINGLKCGENGICEGSLDEGQFTCTCKPGWKGSKCTEETPVKDFGVGSYLVWKLMAQTSPEKNKMQLNFRSRDKDGVLFSVMSESREEFLTLQIRDYKLQLSYHLGSGNRETLRLDNVNASNGHWHTAYMVRYGKQIKLYMDSGEGPYFTETMGPVSGYRKLTISSDNIFGGAIVSGNVIANPELTDFENSCMTDVRLDGNWFPMDYGDTSNDATVSLSKNLTDDCIRDDCAGVNCSPAQNLRCVPLWEDYACKCKPGYVESRNSDEVCVGACFCNNGGTCVYTDKTELGYYCNCPPQYTGVHCETDYASLVRTAALSTAGLTAILACACLLLILVLAVFLYIKLRKPKEKMMLDDDPYDDIRENIVNYDEDGAGEEDMNAFDISRIRVPLDGVPSKKVPFEDPVRRADRPLQSSLPPGEMPDVGNFIEGRLKDADEDLGAPPHDSVREFANEGGGSDAGSLSSLNTSTSSGDQDYDYLNDWGPKFAKLADMYGASQPDDD